MGNKLNTFENGGSHVENPNGGIPQGMGNNGLPNTVEEGETKMKIKGQDYIFSDRLRTSDDFVKQFNLPVYVNKKSFAKASEAIEERFKDRNDNASNSTKAVFMERLAEAQELARLQKEASELGVTVDELLQIKQQEAMAAQQAEMMAQQQSQQGGQMMPEGAQQEMSPEGMPMEIQPTEEFTEEGLPLEPSMMAYGGYMNEYHLGGFEDTNMVARKPVTAVTGTVAPITPLQGSTVDPKLAVPAGEPMAEGSAGGVSGGAIAGALGGIGSLYSMSQNTDGEVKQDKAGSTLSGAATGASAGAALGPIGAGVGAVLGAGVGLFSAGKNNRAFQSKQISKAQSTSAAQTLTENGRAYGGLLGDDGGDPPITQQVGQVLVDRDRAISRELEKQRLGDYPTVGMNITDQNGKRLNTVKFVDKKSNRAIIQDAQGKYSLVPTRKLQLQQKGWDTGGDKPMTSQEAQYFMDNTNNELSYGGLLDENINMYHDGGYPHEHPHKKIATKIGKFTNKSMEEGESEILSARNRGFKPYIPTGNEKLRTLISTLDVAPEEPYNISNMLTQSNTVIPSKNRNANIIEERPLATSIPFSYSGLAQEQASSAPIAKSGIIPMQGSTIQADTNPYSTDQKGSTDRPDSEGGSNWGQYATLGMQAVPFLGNIYEGMSLDAPDPNNIARAGRTYIPNFADERVMLNIVDESYGGADRALAEASGGNLGAYRANLLGANISKTKARSEAYRQISDINRAEEAALNKDFADSIKEGVATTNLERDLDKQDRSAYERQKRDYRIAAYEGLGKLGETIFKTNQMDDLSTYNIFGNKSLTAEQKKAAKEAARKAVEENK